ncbi:MAG: hypothetical protein EOP00_35260 [Pedobacter sp.]|nr:MAG: hypothetical protein EOP00_35260 [Pedobacter sp.]
MNCNCATEFKQKLIELQPLTGVVITKVDLPTIFQLGDGVAQDRLMIEAELTIEGRKTTKKIPIAYAFCPFCGKEAERKEIENG